MSPTKRKTPKNRRPEIIIETEKILRTVKENEAFYFYEAIGKPTGDNAKNLSDFLEKIKSAKLESLTFHQQRNDFKNWIEKTLGDYELAAKIEKIPPTCNNNLRTNIQMAVENRLKTLKETAATVWVNEDLTIAPSNPP